MSNENIKSSRTYSFLQEILIGKESWYWLSFCDPNKEPGKHFLGCCIVKGKGLVTACNNAWELGINPGGEMLGVEIPEGATDGFSSACFNRLLTREEAEFLMGLMVNFND